MKENSIGDRIEEKYTRYINCETDILELTIEEAIFILEKDASVHYVEDLLQEAYKVILSDYKRVLKINEVLLKENEELKEIYRSEKKMKNEYIKLYKEEAEIEFNKYAIVVLKKMLQEILEGRK